MFYNRYSEQKTNFPKHKPNRSLRKDVDVLRAVVYWRVQLSHCCPWKQSSRYLHAASMRSAGHPRPAPVGVVVHGLDPMRKSSIAAGGMVCTAAAMYFAGVPRPVPWRTVATIMASRGRPSTVFVPTLTLRPNPPCISASNPTTDLPFTIPLRLTPNPAHNDTSTIQVRTCQHYLGPDCVRGIGPICCRSVRHWTDRRAPHSYELSLGFVFRSTSP